MVLYFNALYSDYFNSKIVCIKEQSSFRQTVHIIYFVKSSLPEQILSISHAVQTLCKVFNKGLIHAQSVCKGVKSLASIVMRAIFQRDNIAHHKFISHSVKGYFLSRMGAFGNSNSVTHFRFSFALFSVSIIQYYFVFVY